MERWLEVGKKLWSLAKFSTPPRYWELNPGALHTELYHHSFYFLFWHRVYIAEAGFNLACDPFASALKLFGLQVRATVPCSLAKVWLFWANCCTVGGLASGASQAACCKSFIHIKILLSYMVSHFPFAYSVSQKEGHGLWGSCHSGLIEGTFALPPAPPSIFGVRGACLCEGVHGQGALLPAVVQLLHQPRFSFFLQGCLFKAQPLQKGFFDYIPLVLINGLLKFPWLTSNPAFMCKFWPPCLHFKNLNQAPWWCRPVISVTLRRTVQAQGQAQQFS